jgi:carbon monoxide dehydrogenase subunit G
MEMTEFTGEVKTIPYNDQRVFAVLSDLSNLERIKDRIPKDRVKEFTFNSDSCSIEINPIGKIDFQIVDREPYKTIKFATANSPVPLFLWIQLKQAEENVTKMKMTVRAELNPLLKPMLSKPMQDALDKISEMIANLPFEQ